MSKKQFATAVCENYVLRTTVGVYMCFDVSVKGAEDYCIDKPLVGSEATFLAFMGLLGWEFKQIVNNIVGLRKGDDVTSTYYFTQKLPLNNIGIWAAVKELGLYNYSGINLDGVDYIDLIPMKKS